jgi:hypothetical protein
MSQRPNRRIDKATRLWQGRRASIALIAALYCLASVATAVAQDEGARFLDDVEVIDVPPLAEDDESPFINDVEVVDFPHEEPPLRWKLLEAMPRVLSWPDEPLGNFFGHILHMEHDHVESELDEYAIGLQQIPERPPLLVEWNELFLGPGWLEQGIETPTGAIWRPAFWMFGEFRTALQHFDRGDPATEWANRLDLFGQLNLSGTERVLIGMRPLDEERGGARNFSGYELHDGNWIDGWNSHFQTLFFEGDFGEIFPRLDPYDSRMLDYGFSVGRMPLLAQQGLLINEDMIDAVTMTRNTLNGHGNLNLRTTGVYSWRGVNRNSPVGRPNDFDPGSKMVAILTESDFAVRTVNLDATYVYGDPAFGNLFAVGASSIRRHHGYHNTYNTSLHLLASIPEDGRTDFADQGELLFAQTSWTPHHTEDLIYLNSFWAIDQFTSPARGPAMGNALGQTGLLFGGVALGQYNAPIAVRTDNVAGASLGYQMFFDHTRQQVIWEVGGYKETKGASRGAIGSALRYQKAIGQHSILVMDGFVSKHETRRASQGARIEWRIKF